MVTHPKEAIAKLRINTGILLVRVGLCYLSTSTVTPCRSIQGSLFILGLQVAQTARRWLIMVNNQ